LADHAGTDRTLGQIRKQGNGVFYFVPDEVALFSFAPAGTLGNTGRNNFRGPGFYNVDLSLVKKFALTERFKLAYRLEMFNAFNTANFDIPNNNLAAPASFGRVTTLVNGSSGNGARVLQMALRVDF
jgi:hypothetical protein